MTDQEAEDAAAFDRGFMKEHRRFTRDEVVEKHRSAINAAMWRGYRKCPVCKAMIGDPCRSLSGAVWDGRPDSQVTELPAAHNARRRRVRR